MRVWIASLVLVVFALCALAASAGTIMAVGPVDPLTDVSQLSGVYGTAPWEVTGGSFEPVPLGLYSGLGLTFHTGPLSAILPGVTTGGSASQPNAATIFSSNFPAPIGGGGSHTGQSNAFGGVGTFSMPVTQVGMTISNNGAQYLTAWDTSGNILGQVNWQPTGDAAFFGIDTQGVPIGMVALGNDDLWNGASYGVGGATILSDDWFWAAGSTPIPEPGTLLLLALGGCALLTSVRVRRQRRKS